MVTHTPLNALTIKLDFGDTPITVGRLAYKNRKIYFEYDAAFLKSGFEISPFHLPLKAGVQTFDAHLFEGLPGVFNDSLPDGWGRLLMDRTLRSRGYQMGNFSPLDRLAYVGNHGLGALIYEPDHSSIPAQTIIDLDILNTNSQQIMAGESTDVLDELLALNGSSAGARPKAMIAVSDDKRTIIEGITKAPRGYTPWIVKFSNSSDGADAGAVEYVYSQMARLAGVKMMETHLFPAKDNSVSNSANNSGYFATKRFDINRQHQRLHMHTACGLLHSDFRTPSLDYEDLIRATTAITKDMRQVHALYSLAVFNVLSHNRDDHSKNFSYLMDAAGLWKLAPAYDLTFSSGPRGEQSTMVMGEGKNPGESHLLELARKADLTELQAKDVIMQTKEALSQWNKLAKEAGVHKSTRAHIAGKISDKV